mgnify:FL=1
MNITPLSQKILIETKTFFNLLTVLKKIESIVSDDFCHDVEYELFGDRLTTEKEKIMAGKLADIYRYSHAFNSHCRHPDWQEEALK